MARARVSSHLFVGGVGTGVAAHVVRVAAVECCCTAGGYSDLFSSNMVFCERRDSFAFRLMWHWLLRSRRIFFANLTAGNPGEFWGPRIYTVLPLTLIFFFVYAQLEADEQVAETIAVCISTTLLCYFGTAV